jgi:hypothetical protein
MRRLIILLAVATAFLPALALAQDDLDDQPEAQGTTVVEAENPTIDSPEVGVETPDSSMPDDLETSPLPQWWQGMAGVISAALAAFLIRWMPARTWYRLGTQRSVDVKRLFALVAAIVTALVGAWLADTLAFDKVTLSGILFTAVSAWLAREVIPGFKAVTHGIEGPPPPPQTP